MLLATPSPVDLSSTDISVLPYMLTAAALTAVFATLTALAVYRWGRKKTSVALMMLTSLSSVSIVLSVVFVSGKIADNKIERIEDETGLTFIDQPAGSPLDGIYRFDDNGTVVTYVLSDIKDWAYFHEPA